MMSSFDLAFVESISATPTYRLDLNGGNPLSVMGDDSSFGMPELRRARTSTLLDDGDYISASSYGNRVIGIRVQLVADMANKDAAATQVQLLAREVNRETNFLRYRAGTTEPVFFRTFRSDFASVEWDGDSAFATVVVEAEPFAFGLPETLSPQTVTNNPAAGSNGMFFDVSSIRGDVDAATLLVDTSASLYSATAWLATRRWGTVANVPLFRQAESMTLGTDATLPGNDAVMSGSGSNYARVSFGTATMQNRLTMTFPPTISDDARGQYRVLACIRRSNNTDPITVQLRICSADDFTVYDTDILTTSLSTLRHHIDMGLFQLPVGADPGFDGPSGTPLTPNSCLIKFRAARASGTATLDIDYLLFIPADDQHAVIQAGSDSTHRTAYDSYADLAYKRTSGDRVDTSSDVVVMGDLPSLRPGVTNRIFYVQGSSSTNISVTTQFSIKYWPRYMVAKPMGS